LSAKAFRAVFGLHALSASGTPGLRPLGATRAARERPPAFRAVLMCCRTLELKPLVVVGVVRALMQVRLEPRSVCESGVSFCQCIYGNAQLGVPPRTWPLAS
jgi:hypothetical protein